MYTHVNIMNIVSRIRRSHLIMNKYPIRAIGWIKFTGQRRPNKDHQRQWCVCVCEVGVYNYQQWVFVLFLVPEREGLTAQLLAGAPDRAALWRGEYKRTLHEHFTNIGRIQFLAGRHPSGQSVGMQKDKFRDVPSSV